ncbi:MAG TPA: shikimate kinase [Acidobacteriota bacterium]|nr:shikimate kinase [Acidobacteriota bacterium]
MKAIVLVGFMGAGKTEVGKALSKKLGLPLIDLDKEIERLEGKTVGRIFSEEGEDHFRRREREVLQSLKGGDMVLSVGGGAFTTDENIALINSIADSVWIDCPLEICLEHCARTPGIRPLFSDPIEMASLYKHRKRFYKRAKCRVECSTDTPAEIADKVIEALGLEVIN